MSRLLRCIRFNWILSIYKNRMTLRLIRFEHRIPYPFRDADVSRDKMAGTFLNVQLRHKLTGRKFGATRQVTSLFPTDDMTWTRSMNLKDRN